METPKIAFHGGKCCGIKIIHSLYDDPDATADAIVREKRFTTSDPDQFGHEVSSSLNMYNENCEEETYLERVDRYIKWLHAVRPNGIIEVVLAQEIGACSCCDEFGGGGDCEPDPNQVNVWGPLLIERGFIIVNSCHNSNSGNRIHIYHLKTDK